MKFQKLSSKMSANCNCTNKLNKNDIFEMISIGGMLTNTEGKLTLHAANYEYCKKNY
jgi:hypothetical protein